VGAGNRREGKDLDRKDCPVGSLHRSANAPLPSESYAAIMPEKTTAARKNAVPRHSAPLGRRRAWQLQARKRLLKPY
jgi:hypothetical protein